MKKLYFFLMAMMVAVVANAATVYFQNTANWADVYFYCWGGAGASAGWPGDVVTTTVEKDGVTYYKVTTECPSGIFNDGNGTQTSDLQMVDNMIYNASGSTGVSFEGGTIVVEKNFTLAGNFNSYNGNDVAYAFTAEGNDIYTFHLDSLPATGDFAVVENGAVWYKYAATPMESGKTYEMGTAGTTNCTLTGAATDITFEFNASNNTLKVTYTTGGVVVPPTPGTYTYALHGSWASSDWQTIALTEADGKWTATVDVTNPDANFGIQQLENGEQTGWLWSADSATIDAAGTYAVVLEGGAGQNFAISTGKWTLTFDPEANTLTVTGESEEVDYTTWYLNVLGDFNDWQDNGVAFNADGVAELTDLAIGDSIFKLKIWNGADMWISNGEALTVGETYVVKGNTEANMTIANGADYASVSVSYNAVTGELKVSGTTAVAEVEVAEGEAAYYTLQGVKVANPENGIYVKVVDGKASKVVVK